MLRKTLTILSLIGLLLSVSLLATEGRGVFIGSFFVLLPLALVAALIIDHPVALRTAKRRKRKKLGLCLKCGYDLRGSRERCPECGTEFGAMNA